MKPLLELIDGVQDVETKAQKYALGEVDTCHAVDFKAGARSQSCLAEALRDAIKYIEDMRVLAEYESGVEMRIRSILEKETSE